MSQDHNHEEVEYVFIPDDDGNEVKFEVLFKFDVEETNRKYMLLVDAEDDGDEDEPQEVLAFRYEEDGEDGFQLFTLDDDEEWDLVEEAFNTFLDEEEEA